MGFQWQSLSYDVKYTLTTTTRSIFGENTDVQELHKCETGSHGDFYPIFGWSDKVALTSSCLTVTHGIYFDVTRSFRVIAGARCLWMLGPDSSDPSFFVAPVLLFDFGL